MRELIAHALRTGLAYVDDVRTGEAPGRPLAGRLGWEADSRRRVSGREEVSRGCSRNPARLCADGSDSEGRRSAVARRIDSARAGTQIGSTVDVGCAANRSRYGATCVVRRGNPDREERAGKTPRYTVQRTIHCEDRRQRLTALRLWKVIGEHLGDDDIDGIDGSGPDGGGSPIGDGGPGIDDPDSGGSASPDRPLDLVDLLAMGPDGRSDDIQSTVSKHVQSLTSPAISEEFQVGSYYDADGHKAVAQPMSPAQGCSVWPRLAPSHLRRKRDARSELARKYIGKSVPPLYIQASVAEIRCKTRRRCQHNPLIFLHIRFRAQYRLTAQVRRRCLPASPSRHPALLWHDRSSSARLGCSTSTDCGCRAVR